MFLTVIPYFSSTSPDSCGLDIYVGREPDGLSPDEKIELTGEEYEQIRRSPAAIERHVRETFRRFATAKITVEDEQDN